LLDTSKEVESVRPCYCFFAVNSPPTPMATAIVPLMYGRTDARQPLLRSARFRERILGSRRLSLPRLIDGTVIQVAAEKAASGDSTRSEIEIDGHAAKSWIRLSVALPPDGN
jgi:hypothetical protein